MSKKYHFCVYNQLLIDFKEGVIVGSTKDLKKRKERKKKPNATRAIVNKFDFNLNFSSYSFPPHILLLLLLVINSWTRTHSHAASGAISWPWHWCTSTRLPAVVVGPQALWSGVFMCVCTLAPRLTAYEYQRVHEFIFINNSSVTMIMVYQIWTS